MVSGFVLVVDVVVHLFVNAEMMRAAIVVMVAMIGLCYSVM
jgi:hypothetical protein